jgi:hypothetical protein
MDANMKRPAILMLLLIAVGCVDEPIDPPADDLPTSDLPVGDVLNPRADGFYGAATTCKEIPPVEPLNDPKIVISLDGLTLRLTDQAGTYDRVFPIGVGAMEEGESLTPTSTQYGRSFYTRTDEPPTVDGPTPDEARWGWNHSCRMWWTSSETGEKIPVFAGLPFIRLAGHPSSAAYGIHGPVDNYTMPSGGTLRRGYVSHGCIRMSAEGIVEVYGRLQGRRAEVVIQKPVERRSDGEAVDFDPWLLSECQSDADCDFDEGFCQHNEYRGAGFCTRSCTRYCPDRDGHPTSFCVPNPDGAGNICTLKSTPTATDNCRRLQGFVEHPDVARPDESARADVCLPGSGGWIGDRCLSDGECDTGLCTPVEGGPGGVCTESCYRYCPDREGAAGTFCIDAPPTVPRTGGMCVRRCFDDSHCPAGTECREMRRRNQPSVVVSSCVPL